MNMCDDDNDQEKQAGQGVGGGEKDVAFYCRCPQIVITRVAASLATPAQLTVVAVVVAVAAAPSLSVPVTVVQEIQICKISRGRSVRWINGDMLREVSTDCAELGRRKKL